MLRELLLQAGADGVVRQHLPGVDLNEPLLDFADEPVVVVDGSLDCFADQYLSRNASSVSRPGQFALKVGRQVHFHTASVLTRHGVSTSRSEAHRPRALDLKGRHSVNEAESRRVPHHQADVVDLHDAALDDLEDLRHVHLGRRRPVEVVQERHARDDASFDIDDREPLLRRRSPGRVALARAGASAGRSALDRIARDVRDLLAAVKPIAARIKVLGDEPASLNGLGRIGTARNRQIL